MTPGDNILYFNVDDRWIDVRLCPKNAQTALTHLWAYTHLDSLQQETRYNKKQCMRQLKKDYKRYGGGAATWRKQRAVRQQYAFDPPFRKGSFRLAVKRDPVKRFISACNTIRRWTRDEAQPLYNIRPPMDLDQFNVDDLLHLLHSGRWSNEHFFTQTYFLGNPHQYDSIIDISEIPFTATNALAPYTSINVEKVKPNKSTYNTQLTDKQTRWVQELYRIDYENGYY